MNYYAILQELAKEYPKIPMPNLVATKDKNCSGFYQRPDKQKILCCGDFWKENKYGTIFINDKYWWLYKCRIENTIAHEYMHHIQHHESRNSDETAGWNKKIWVPYKYKIIKFFKHENELEALLYSNKKYPSKSSLKWEKWVRKNANI